MKRLLPSILLGSALALPAPSAAETVAPDPQAKALTALGGTIVWISGDGPGQRLMQRTPDGVIAPVNSPEAPYYRDLDLGRDADGRLLLTYARCSTPANCVYMWDDLGGRRSHFRGLAPGRCTLSTTPSRWRKRVAYGLACFTRKDGRKVADDSRSGLYVRSGSASPQRLSAPRAVRRAGADSITSVDLRGRSVAAIYADISAFGVLRGVRPGSPARPLRIASSEGDTDQRAAGLALASSTRYFALTQSTYPGDPARSIIHRQTAECDDYQVLTAPAGPEGESAHPVLDVAADCAAVYVVTTGVGISRHEYRPDIGC